MRIHIGREDLTPGQEIYCNGTRYVVGKEHVVTAASYDCHRTPNLLSECTLA
jgi:hypothetical protein